MPYSLRPPVPGLQDPITGRFVKGNTPPAGFQKYPENMGNGSWSPKHTFSFQYKRFMAMPRKEFERVGKCWGIIKPTREDKKEGKEFKYFDHTMAEENAFRAVLRSNQELGYLKEITDRTEGKPDVRIEAKVDNRLSNLTDEELKRMVDNQYGRRKDTGNSGD